MGFPARSEARERDPTGSLAGCCSCKGCGLIVRWLKSAQRSRFEQLNYIAQDSPSAAIRLDEEIERQTDLLAQYPLMGRVGRVEGTRELVVGRTPFIAVYRVNRRRVDILRRLDGAKQWPILSTRTSSPIPAPGLPRYARPQSQLRSRSCGHCLWRDTRPRLRPGSGARSSKESRMRRRSWQ